MASPPERLNVSTQHLEYLLAIEHAPTWAEAAADVGVSASALSQGIAELERRLGLSLFARDGRRRVPSRDHPEVLDYAVRVLAATNDLARWAARRRAGETGVVRLGLIDAAATHHCRSALRSFRQEQPDIDLRLTVAPSAELLASLTAGALDVAVCVEPPAPLGGVTLRHLADDALAVLAPPDGAVARDPGRWGPWVTFPVGSHTRRLVAAALRAAGAGFEVVAESHQPEVLRDMVLLGVGWTVLPTAGLDIGELRVVRRRVAERHLVVATRDRAAPHPAVDAVVSAVA